VALLTLSAALRMGSVADSDDVMSVAPSDFSLVSDVQDAQTSAPDGQPMEATLPSDEVSREDLKPVHHPVFSFENDLVALQVRLRYIVTG
jgi:hypothetical protein